MLVARARSTGDGPTRRPLFGPQVGCISDRPGPVERPGGVQPGQQDPRQLVEDPGVGSAVPPPPAGHPGAEPHLLGEVLPADAGVQHEQDPLQTPPVISATLSGESVPQKAEVTARDAPTHTHFSHFCFLSTLLCLFLRLFLLGSADHLVGEKVLGSLSLK